MSTGAEYRIIVRVAGTPLGYADITPVSSGKELKNLETEETIGLIDGKTLPLKFRVEEGAVFVVPPGGATITTPDGTVTLEVPDGALETQEGLTVEPVSTLPDDPEVVPGTVYDFGPDGTTFDTPITIGIKYDPGKLPARVQHVSAPAGAGHLGTLRVGYICCRS